MKNCRGLQEESGGRKKTNMCFHLSFEVSQISDLIVWYFPSIIMFLTICDAKPPRFVYQVSTQSKVPQATEKGWRIKEDGVKVKNRRYTVGLCMYIYTAHSDNDCNNWCMYIVYIYIYTYVYNKYRIDITMITLCIAYNDYKKYIYIYIYMIYIHTRPSALDTQPKS